MPTYEYECEACGDNFEFFQAMSEAPKKKCPKCGKSKLRKLISAGGGLIFKGSGFYITDYRSDSYKKDASADASSSSSSSASGESKSGDSAKDGASKESKSSPDPKPKPESKSKSESKSDSKPSSS